MPMSFLRESPYAPVEIHPEPDHRRPVAAQLDIADDSLDEIGDANITRDVLDIDVQLPHIEHHGLAAGLECGLHDVRADEAGTSGYQHARHRHTVRLP
jgi:hypothetical protein